MQSLNTKSRNGALIGVVVLLGFQIPTTIALIEPAWLRAVFQVCTLLIVVALAFKVNIPETMPKPSKIPRDDEITPKEPHRRIPRQP